MRKYKLKKWVIVSIYVISIGAVIASFIFLGKFMAADYEATEISNYVSDELVNDDTVRVLEPTNETVNHPYLLENVQIAKNFYDKSDDESKQINSLIYYKNTYMENTGVLYSSSEAFDVVSVLDGTVTSITKDEILGNVVEIMHTNELITVYHCLNDVEVSVGDSVKQNDVIGTSGIVNIDDGYQNALLFEVNYKGTIINPMEFYNMKISDLLG